MRLDYARAKGSCEEVYSRLQQEQRRGGGGQIKITHKNQIRARDGITLLLPYHSPVVEAGSDETERRGTRSIHK